MTGAQNTEITLFDEVCAAYEARIAARERLAEVERESARDSKVRVGCICLMIGLMAGGVLSL